MLNEKYKNINLEKLIGEYAEPDEKIIYATKCHWSLLLFSLIFLFFSFIGFLLKSYQSFFSIGGFIILLLAIISLFIYLKLNVILTTKRCVIPLTLKKKGILLKDIITVTSYENILGGGRLFIEHKNYPQKLIPVVNFIENVKELECHISEQLKLTVMQNETLITTKKKIIKSKYEVPILIICFLFIQSFLTYKNLTYLSKVLTIFFVAYLAFNKLSRKYN